MIYLFWEKTKSNNVETHFYIQGGINKDITSVIACFHNILRNAIKFLKWEFIFDKDKNQMFKESS